MKATAQPFGLYWYGTDTEIFDEEKWSKVALADTLRRYCLTSVIYPNKDTIAYDYNQYFELVKITSPSGGKTEYSYDNYGYTLTGTPVYGRYTRSVDTIKVKYSDESLVSMLTYTRTMGNSQSNPDSAIITDIYGNETVAIFQYQTLPYGETTRMVAGIKLKDIRYSGSHTGGAVIDSTVYTTLSDSKDQYGRPLYVGRNTRPDSTINYVGTKKYITRYRQYDSYGNPRRIDYLGDVSATQVDRSVFSAYLHESKAEYDWDHAHMLGLACSTYVKPDSASARVLSKVKYFYDDTARVDTSGYNSYPPFNWQSPGMIRGNVTRVCRWKAGSLYDTTQIFYDQCGNAVKAINVKGDSSRTIYAPPADPDKYQYALPWRSVGYVSIGGSGDSLCATTEYDTCTGLATSATDANGQVSHFDYDSLGRPTKVARPTDYDSWTDWGGVSPSVIHHYYDRQTHRPTVDSVKYTAGNYLVTKTFYDDLGRAIQTQSRDIDGKAIIANKLYDSLSRVYKVTNPIKTTTDFGTYVGTDYWTTEPVTKYYYDAVSRPLMTVHQDTTRDSMSYVGNRVTAFNARNDTAAMINNSFGKPDTVIDALGRNTIYKYTRLGQDSVITDASGKETKCYYDTLGRLRGANGPNASSTYTYLGNAVDALLEYDGADNVVWRKNSKGAISIKYDALSRVTGIDSASASYPTVKYQYDTYYGSNYTTPPDSLNFPRGRLTMLVTVSADTTWYVYDKLGRVRKRVFAYAGMSGGRDSVRYFYNSADACTALVYPSGDTVRYRYNAAGRLAGLPGYIDSLAYNAAGLPTRIDYGNDQRNEYGYDNRLRISTLKNKVSDNPSYLFSLTYSYWNTGNVKKIQDNINGDCTQYFDADTSYDALGRLHYGVIGSTGMLYAYDSVGNRRTEKVGGVTNTFSYTSGTDKLSSATINYDSYTFTHDNAGNLTAKNGGGHNRAFAYNFNNLLVKATISLESGGDRFGTLGVGDRTITNTYGGGGGLRIKKVDSQLGTRYYAYEGGSLLCEYDASGNVKKKYIYAMGKCIAFIDSAGTKHFMHQDAISSTRVITDNSGGSENAYKYYPFGDSLYASGTVQNDLKFTGQPQVPGIEAYDYSARYYDPDLGRFYSLDPIPSFGSPYAYCGNNPLRFTDPSGMDGTHDPNDADWWIPRIGEESYYEAISHGPGHTNCGDEGGKASFAGHSGWTDASGDPWEIAMDPWATSPRRMYLDSYLQYAADHPNEAYDIAQKLAEEGFTITVTSAIYFDGGLGCISQQTFGGAFDRYSGAGTPGVASLRDIERENLILEYHRFLVENTDKKGTWRCGDYAAELMDRFDKLNLQYYNNYQVAIHIWGIGLIPSFQYTSRAGAINTWLLPWHTFVICIGRGGQVLRFDPFLRAKY